MPVDENQSGVIRELAEQLRRIEQSARQCGTPQAQRWAWSATLGTHPATPFEDSGRATQSADEEFAEPAIFSTGLDVLDRMLPAGGFVRGSLIEWLAEGEGAGAATLAIVLARPTLQVGGALVVVDGEGEFYAPATAGLGVPPGQTLVVRPQGKRDALWAFEQSLRCPGVAVSLYRAERLNDRQGRRLQLASEVGGGLGLLVRPLAAQREPSWADVRLLVRPSNGTRYVGGRKSENGSRKTEPSYSDLRIPNSEFPTSNSLARRWQIELLHCRGGMSGGKLELELDDETGFVRVVSPMAAPMPVRRAAGA